MKIRQIMSGLNIQFESFRNISVRNKEEMDLFAIRVKNEMESMQRFINDVKEITDKKKFEMNENYK